MALLRLVRQIYTREHPVFASSVKPFRAAMVRPGANLRSFAGPGVFDDQSSPTRSVLATGNTEPTPSEPERPPLRSGFVSFINVTKTYGDRTALSDLSFTISKGEFVFITGTEGAGKTTVLRLIMKDDEPDQGQLWVAGEDLGRLSQRKVPFLRRNIGWVGDNFNLTPDKTAFENVAIALEVLGKSSHVVRTQVSALLELVGLSRAYEKYPHELSGGEQQRVAIARAFVNRPLILIVDEPTARLDPKTSVGILRLLDRINRVGVTVIVATEDRAIVDTVRRRVIEVDAGHLVSDSRPGYRKLQIRSGNS